jgi:hypothetical protein
MRVVVLTLLLSMTMVSGTPGQQPESVELISREIEAAVERLGSERAVRIGSTTLVHSGALVGVYERRGFAPIWNDSSSRRDLVQTVADVRLDGLDPAHYHGAALTSLSSMERGPEVTAILDLLATDALIRVAHDLRFGKVVPRGPTTGPRDPSPFGGDDFVADLIRVVESGRVREAILDLRPSHFVYARDPAGHSAPRVHPLLDRVDRPARRTALLPRCLRPRCGAASRAQPTVTGSPFLAETLPAGRFAGLRPSFQLDLFEEEVEIGSAGRQTGQNASAVFLHPRVDARQAFERPGETKQHAPLGASRHPLCDGRGSRILRAGQTQRFVPVTDRDYDPIREMERVARRVPLAAG